ncbi:hypothetical protein [Methylobacterium oxalidis]|uniref:hypothetical protein n=1 Tax=Methylobacterium oxalidis TaxID=944322 RepID=UPI00331560F6
MTANQGVLRLSIDGAILCEQTMSEPWLYQLRICLPDELVEAARTDLGSPELAPLAGILAKHHATMLSQFDAFAGYVAEAEREGIEGYPLYVWTNVTLEDPEKRAKHLKSFALHVNGREIYSRDEADALEADLRPLVGGTMIERLSKHDTNPANNPQPPEQYRRRSVT